MEETKKEILQLVRDHLTIEIQNDNELNLVSTTFNEDEIIDAIDSLLSTRVTMGKKVELFEKKWNNYLIDDQELMIRSVMVNSGSSANLLALSVLMDCSIDGRLLPGDEVIVPAVTWSTTIFPIIQLGLVPVIVDVDLETMTISVDEIKKALSPRTRAIMPVHLLGNPCDMEGILEIAEKNDLFVIEDCCEAHGAKYGDRMVGTMGDLSTFSFFYSHHITTIEGGMVSTKHPDWLSLIRSYRAHGWVREREDKEKLIEENKELDPRFLFVTSGYNFRPTEINGAFGIHQIEKLESFIKTRIKNHKRMIEIFRNYNEFFILPEFAEGTRHSAFAFGLIVKENKHFTKNDFQAYLEENGIQTRPIAGSNLIHQPAFRNMHLKTIGDLKNSDIIHENGFWVGNHPLITENQFTHLQKKVEEFMKRVVGE